MILLIPLVVIFLFFWILIFLWHEVCHIIEGFRKGANEGKITIETYKGIPTMNCWSNYYPNGRSVQFAGGLYSGITSLLIGLIPWYTHTLSDFIFEFPLITIGIVNIVYGIYEGIYIHKIPYGEYMKYHYVVYGITILVMTLIYIPKIIEFVNLW